MKVIINISNKLVINAIIMISALTFLTCLTTSSEAVRGENVPSSTTKKVQDDFWSNYKHSFLRVLPKGTIVVDSYSGLTPSEGMGHALIFSAEREDWAVFDSLVSGLSYYRKGNGLFRWKINSDGTFYAGNENLASASETEQNVTYAFLIAYEKTGDHNYLKMALDLLGIIWKNEVVSFQDKLIVLPADRTDNPYWPINSKVDPNQAAWNPSYFSPKIYRKFARYDKVHNWSKVVNDGYYLMNIVLDRSVSNLKEYGIAGINPMPAWVWLVPDGQMKIDIKTYFSKGSEQYTGKFSNEWDTIRIPLYIGMDASSVEGRKFLKRFYDHTKIVRPEDAVIGRGFNPEFPKGINSMMAIGAYAVGLRGIGRNTKPFIQRLSVDKAGFTTEPRTSYYDQTFCYYSWLLLNDKFPF